MQPFEQIKQYSRTVCEQIRWKSAHDIISDEIENHICDQRDAYISQGDDEKTATQKALLQMGDAVTIGMELDKTHKPKPQWTMILITAILMLIGIFARYYIDSSEHSLYSVNLFPSVFAIVIFFAAYFFDFTVLGKYANYFYYSVLFASIIGILLSNQIFGSLWFSLGSFSLSLTYLSLIFPMVYSLLIYPLRNKGYTGIILCGVGYIPFAVGLMFTGTISGLVLFTISALIVLCASIAKGWFGINKKKGLSLVLIPTVLTFTGMLYYVLQNTNFSKRLNSVLNPCSDKDGFGYLACQVRNLLANSQFIGKGSTPEGFSSNILDMPVIDTDYILTALTYNFGWIVFIAVTLVFLIFTILGLYYVSKQKSVLGYLVSLSVMLTIIFQFVFYVLNNLGYGFLVTLSLPLISYGKVALIINSALIGFMLSVFRTGDIFKDVKYPVKNNSIVSFEDGKLIINFKA